MRLLVVSSEFPPGPGGIGTHAFSVVRGLASLGWDATVVTCQDHASDDEVTRFNAGQSFRIVRLESFPIRAGQAFLRFVTATRAFRNVEPDVVIATGLRAVWLCGLLLPISRKP